MLAPPTPTLPFIVRRPREADHPCVLAELDRWWAGALGDTDEAARARHSLERALLLPRLFFQHFTASSTIVEHDGAIIAFLMGFLSETEVDTAYIHFIGIAPSHRGRGLGRSLYERFIAHAKDRGRSKIECVTSPTNRGSIAFHTRMGFAIKPSDELRDGVPVQRDYDGPGLDRVVFVLRI